MAFMLLLFALIFRAVSLEFRGKRDSQAWKRFWDYSFFGASALATFLFGVAAGNVLVGIPINASGVFTGADIDLLAWDVPVSGRDINFLWEFVDPADGTDTWSETVHVVE